jgi:predicted HTH domain antitoxin
MTIEEAVFRYQAKEFSVTRMSKLLGMPISQVLSLLKERGVQTLTKSEEVRAKNLREGKTTIPNITDELIDDAIREYLSGNINQTKAAKKCGISQQNFSLKLREYKKKQI